jgi:hypothetical protein
LLSCSRNNERSNYNLPTSTEKKEIRLSHASYFIDNSGGMFGYVSQGSEFVKAISELTQKPMFITENVSKDFNFINGTRNLQVTNFGDEPNRFNSRLNPVDFNVGNIQGNDLNAMFQYVLSKVNDDTLSIFVSDYIYDIQQKDGNALAPLIVEGRETRRTFLQKLSEKNIQTLIIRMESTFKGVYYHGVQSGRFNLEAKRPYFIYIFGENEILNKYFSDVYINGLAGYMNHYRFFVPKEDQIQYEVIAYNMIGSYRVDRGNRKTINRPRPFRDQFQFSIAVDFSSLSLTDQYLMDTYNYETTHNYTITNIERYDMGLVTSFEPNYVITFKTTSFSLGDFELKLKNNTPDWFKDLSTDDDSDIISTIDKTFGFSHLIDGIQGAYEHSIGNGNLAKLVLKINR